MTGQDFIDFIHRHNAEDDELMVYHGDLGLYFFPELRDMGVIRAGISIDTTACDVLTDRQVYDKCKPIKTK